MRPRISVICTAYNAAEFISQTIGSVLDQTMGELGVHCCRRRID